MRGLIFLVVFLLSSFSCTRNVPDPLLTMRIGTSNGQGGLSADDYLAIVIVNVKVPGKGPIVREIEYHDSDNPPVMGVPINLEIKDIPKGDGFFIQVLAVYESQTNGAMKFLYGDANANVTGDTTVNITAANAGTSNKMIRLAGRYLSVEDPSNSGDDVGPTGVMIAQFQPPNSKPPMNVQRSYMINGWFQAFAIDSTTAGFRYVMENGTVVFDNFNASSTFLTPSAKLMKIVKPVSFRRENRGDGSEIRTQPLTDMYLGFFNSGSPAQPKYSCYSTAQEGVPGVYLTAAMTTPLIYTGVSGGASDMRIAAGGTTDSFSMFGGMGTNCDDTALSMGRATIFHHFNADDEEGFSGFSPPFRSMRPLEQHRSFLVGIPDFTNPGAPVWNLKWRYLPGAEAVLAGTEIFFRQNTMGGGGGGGKESCESMADRGYQPAGSTNVPGETFAFSNANMTNSNYHNFSFAACAYRMNNGIKQYLGRPAEGHCLSGSCGGGMDHFGWGSGDSAPGAAVTFNSLGGNSRRITGIPENTDLYTEVQVSNDTGYTPGKEMLIHVSGATTGACGTYNGQTIQAGMFQFTRLLQTGGFPRVPKGTFLDTIGTASLANSTDSTNFCYVQMVQVPHFKNLDLSATTVTPTAFDYGGTGGGIVAFRVSGTFNLGGSGDGIVATGKGYSGGANTIPNGGGDKRAPSATPTSHMGGTDGTGAGGGGGYGSGGNAGTGAGGWGMSGCGSGGMCMPIRMMFGGGGVGVGAPGTGSGGGIVFIMANRMTSYSGAIHAEGASATNYSGGGGGSINVFTRQLTGLGSGGINFLAQGGNAGTGGGNMGGGGGGYASVLACSNDLTGATNFQNAGGSPTNSGASGQAGNPTVYNPPSQFWMCQ